MSAVPSRLRGEQLTLAYGNKTIAESLNVTIPDGHFTAIIGPNGCGKSTLLRTLSRLMTPASGHVWLDGAQIQQYASKEVARRIGLLAQNATTPGDITVQELVARGRYPHQPLFTRWRKEDEEAVNKAMRATGISDLALQSVDTLSGGQRQRAWIAMVLAQETAIMLLDEPTTWLDISHQIDLLEAGKEVIQETRRWDDNKEYSYAMRSKEDAQDYRYFPDPDLVPVYISDEWLESIRSKQPEFRTEKMKRYKEEYDIPEYDIDIITGSKHLADIFEASVALGSQPKKVSNWLMVETMRLLKEKEMEPEDIRFSPEHLSRLIALVDGKVINSSVAKEVFQVMFEEDVDPEQYVEEKGLKTVNDEGALRKVVEEVIAANPQSVEDYHNGKEKAIGFLVGQTMKAMKGKADPASVNQMLKELL